MFKENKKLEISFVLFVIILSISINLFLDYPDLIQEKFFAKELNSNDFKIKSIQWSKDIDWNLLCEIAKEDPTFKSNFYEITTTQNHNLACKTSINNKATSEYYGSLTVDNPNIGERTHSAPQRDSLNPSIDNLIEICCIPDQVFEKDLTGEVCDFERLYRRC